MQLQPKTYKSINIKWKAADLFFDLEFGFLILNEGIAVFPYLLHLLLV